MCICLLGVKYDELERNVGTFRGVLVFLTEYHRIYNLLSVFLVLSNSHFLSFILCTLCVPCVPLLERRQTYIVSNMSVRQLSSLLVWSLIHLLNHTLTHSFTKTHTYTTTHSLTYTPAAPTRGLWASGTTPSTTSLCGIPGMDAELNDQFVNIQPFFLVCFSFFICSAWAAANIFGTVFLFILYPSLFSC